MRRVGSNACRIISILAIDTNDGARLYDQFHQYLWPGETGLAQCLAVLRQIYWGASPPSGVSL